MKVRFHAYNNWKDFRGKLAYSWLVQVFSLTLIGTAKPVPDPYKWGIEPRLIMFNFYLCVDVYWGRSMEFSKLRKQITRLNANLIRGGSPMQIYRWDKKLRKKMRKLKRKEAEVD
jgi:hypothetical protein